MYTKPMEFNGKYFHTIMVICIPLILEKLMDDSFTTKLFQILALHSYFIWLYLIEINIYADNTYPDPMPLLFLNISHISQCK